jgi:hypothetical protein
MWREKEMMRKIKHGDKDDEEEEVDDREDDL